MTRKSYIVGIDPDIDKSGVAMLDMVKKQFVYLGALPFPRLLEFVESNKDDACFVVEDSDIATSFHYIRTDKPAIIFAKGRSVGLCHATFRHLCEYLDYVGAEYVKQRPLRKMWKGKDRKITHEELSYFVSGLPKRTSQDVRDACLLAWNEARLPIKVKAR